VIDALLLALALGVSVAGPAPSDTPLPAPSATSEAVPSAQPEPSATPLAAPSAAATADPYKYRFVPRQPDNPAAGTPQIFAVFLNDRTLRSRGPILIKVITSADVVKVVSKSNGREGILQPIGPGDFEANSQLPKIPFIAAGMTATLEFVAVNGDGKSVSVKVPVKLE
jgi:hypothetical protein